MVAKVLLAGDILKVQFLDRNFGTAGGFKNLCLAVVEYGARIQRKVMDVNTYTVYSHPTYCSHMAGKGMASI